MIKMTLVMGGKETEIEIHEIPEKDLKSHKLLGTAEGINKGHCVYMAQKYARNFWKRVTGYRSETPKEKGAVAIAFYEKQKVIKRKAKNL